MFRLRLLHYPILLLALISQATAQFAHTDHKQIVDPAGKPLFVRATNLGNWLVPEGYMWLFQDGPQSPSEISALVFELLGPEGSAAFWQNYRDARRHRLPASGRLQRHPSSFALQSV